MTITIVQCQVERVPVQSTSGSASSTASGRTSAPRTSDRPACTRHWLVLQALQWPCCLREPQVPSTRSVQALDRQPALLEQRYQRQSPGQAQSLPANTIFLFPCHSDLTSHESATSSVDSEHIALEILTRECFAFESCVRAQLVVRTVIQLSKWNSTRAVSRMQRTS